MNKIIPRHSLVVAVGPNEQHRNGLVNSNFDDYEILSADKISHDLIGDVDYARLSGILFPELRRRAEMKLGLGERVVINASNLKRDDRLSFANIAMDMGVPVFYLLASPDDAPPSALALWRGSQRDLARGDGIAEVVDVGTSLSVIPRCTPDLSELRRDWNGITVIGDVHGMQQSLLSAISWARTCHHYIIFLGDVVDYGPQTLEVADLVYSLVMRGEAEIMLGNHERKIWRWLRHGQHGQGGPNLSEGNKVTTRALAQLSTKAYRQWSGRFSALVNHAQYVRKIGPFVLAHAAIHEGYWDGSASKRDIENLAIFGEFEAPLDPRSNVQVSRTYSWVEAIPEGRTVIIGHDIRRTQMPLKVTNEAGGHAIFLDTGCGKGGRLSSVDLRWIDGDEIAFWSMNMY